MSSPTPPAVRRSAGLRLAEQAERFWSEAALVAAKDGRRKISDEDYLIGFEKVREQRRRIKPPRQDGDA